jgi:hypothetical protein
MRGNPMGDSKLTGQMVKRPLRSTLDGVKGGVDDEAVVA